MQPLQDRSRSEPQGWNASTTNGYAAPASLMRLERLVFGCASSFQTGSDRQGATNRGSDRDVGEQRRGWREGVSTLDRRSMARETRRGWIVEHHGVRPESQKDGKPDHTVMAARSSACTRAAKLAGAVFSSDSRASATTWASCLSRSKEALSCACFARRSRRRASCSKGRPN